MNPWLLTLTSALVGCSVTVEPAGLATAPHSTHDQQIDPYDTAASPGQTNPKSGMVFAGDRPLNLLIISFDTLRYDRIGTFAGNDATPFLDSLLQESVVHTDLRGCSNWTYPSLLCLMTGQSSVDLGFEPVTGDAETQSLPAQLDMLPLWLQNRGFDTAAVTGSPWLTTEPGVLTGEGFDTIVYDDWGDPSAFPGADWTTSRALTQAGLLQNDDRDRWYLHVHYMDPHTPYDAPAEYRSALADLAPIDFDLTTAQGLHEAKQDFGRLAPDEQDLLLEHFRIHYEAGIRFMDDELESLWSGLSDLGALDDTLVLFWSDHGEQFYDHRKWGHSQGLNQEENRAMAAWWAKDLVPKTWNVPVAHQDLLHLAFRALRLTPEESWTGRDPDTVASDRLRTAFRYHVDQGGWWMATRQDRVLTYRCDGTKALYDVAEDPLEQVDIYDPQDPAVVRLWDDLDLEIERTLAYLPQLDCEERGP